MAINPTQRNLPEQVSGDDITLPIQVLDEGVEKDISNWTFTWEFEKIDDGDGTADLTVTESTHDDASSGQTSIEVPSSESSNLEGEYAYDLYFDDGTGVRKTFLYGRIQVVPDAADR